MQPNEEHVRLISAREDQARLLPRFLPVKRKATVRGCHIECSEKHYGERSFRFRVNGEADLDGREVYLEYGYKVLIAFHPGHPERGCHVFNGERGERNQRGEFGAPILLAPMAEDVAQTDRSGGERTMHARKANAAFRGGFHAIVGTGKPAARRSEARDGQGFSVERFDGQEPPNREAPGERHTRQRDDRASELIERATRGEVTEEELAKLAEREAAFRKELLLP